VRFVALLAFRRLGYRPARWLLVALGVAAATVLPVLAQNSGTLVAAQAVRYGIAQLDPGQRSLVATKYSLSLPESTLDVLGAEVRRRIAPLTDTPPRAELLYGRLSLGAGGTYFFAATDNLASAVRVTSGRAPASCTPQRCEVVVLGAGTPHLDPSLGLVIVGRAVRTDPLLLSGPLSTGHDAPVLLADGVPKAAALASLDLFRRTYAWVSPIDLDRVQRLGVDAYIARSVQANDELQNNAYRIALSAPDDTLRAEDDRARRSARRFALLGGSADALLLGFAAIGAIGLRRDHTAVADLLRRRGAPRRGVALLAAVESAVPVLAGAAVGMLTGVLASGARGTAAGLPYWFSAGSAARGAALTVVFAAVTAWLLVTLVRSWPSATGRAAWRVLDAVVVAGLAVVALAVSRGTVTATDLADRTDPLLPVLPVLFVVCGGLLVGRAWPVLVALGARLLPRRLLAGRLGLLGALRRPLRPVATAAFVAAASGIVVFAAGYQATLAQGAAEQATFAVPLSATVATGSTLVRPLELTGLPGYAHLAPGVSAYGVVRSDAGITLSSADTLTAQLLGVDPAALPRIPSWQHVAGGVDAATAARLIRAPSPQPSTQDGLAVPAGTDRIAFPVSGDLSQIQLTAWLRAADGRDASVPLTPGRGSVVAGPIPGKLTQPVKLFAVVVAQASDFTTIQQHHLGEGGTNTAILQTTITLGAPTFAGATGSGWAGWGSTDTGSTDTGSTDTGSGGTVSTANGVLTIAYRFGGNRIVVRPGAGALVAPIPVLADPVTAARAGDRLLPLVVNANQPVQARVVGVLPRFPTLGTRFLVADAGLLGNALDAQEPGAGSVSEVWLSAPADLSPADGSPADLSPAGLSPAGGSAALSAALATDPYDQLQVSIRDDLARQLAGDPVARGASALLTASALLALLIAVLSVVLLVVAERRDESAELYAWESDGVAPGTLRRSLFARACAVVAVAVPGGLLIGAALSTVTTGLVTVTAVGTSPDPPLFLAIGPTFAGITLAVGIALGLLAAAAVAGVALRERLPRRPEEQAW
jgi:hypothetical protein